MIPISRRTVLKLSGAAAAAAWVRPSFAQGSERRHGLSLFGDLKYPPDFTHFGYVEPAAPKGGRLVTLAPNWILNQSPLTFNTLNSFVNKGDAPPRMEMTFDSLLVGAADEPDSYYGLVAEGVEISDDENELRFFLRDTPRFHDGSPLTADDVVFTMQALKEKGHPSLQVPLVNVVSVEAAGPREVVVRLTGKQSRGLRLDIAGLPIFSKAYHADKDIEASTLIPPLGSGPYKVGALSAGNYIEYERVPDYWGADLAVNAGQYNFDVIRIEFFRERTAGFEALKKGLITLREEFTSKSWATEYNLPAIAEGKILKTVVAGEARPDFQGFYLNTRRPQLSDPKTRQAIALAFDFEWINRNLFYGLYERSSSYFQGSPYAATGTPSPEELALLEPHRADLPPEVFGEAYVPPKSDGSGRDRKLLGQASRLLQEAGWQREGNVLVRDGVRLTVEFLVDDPQWERVLGTYIESLGLIGVEASIRQVDPVQYQLRQNTYDFDSIGMRLQLEATPLEGLRTLVTSSSADAPGAHNLAGIKSPAVDALVDKALQAPDRETHRVALSALDRVLRAGHYSVPEWHKGEHWVAHWDMFGRPAAKPDYAFPYESTWWFDLEKAQRLGRAG
jgi:microcin C transport system substrate-binding protein